EAAPSRQHWVQPRKFWSAGSRSSGTRNCAPPPERGDDSRDISDGARGRLSGNQYRSDLWTPSSNGRTLAKNRVADCRDAPRPHCFLFLCESALDEVASKSNARRGRAISGRKVPDLS